MGNIKQWWAQFTPEERSEIAKQRAAQKTFEERSAIAKKREAQMKLKRLKKNEEQRIKFEIERLQDEIALLSEELNLKSQQVDLTQKRLKTFKRKHYTDFANEIELREAAAIKSLSTTPTEELR